MKITRILSAAIILLLSVSRAIATDLPSFDTEAYCRSLTAVLNTGADFIRNSCLDQEKQRRGQVALLIKYFDSDEIKQCEALARASTGGSYQVFAGCLIMNLAQKILEGKLAVVPAKSNEGANH
jgi:hypothetical protein